MKIEELNERKQKRAQLIADARKINETAEKEKRELTADEETQFENRMTEADQIQVKVKREERIKTAQDSLDAIDRGGEHRDEPGAGAGETASNVPLFAKPEYRAAFNDYLRFGMGDPMPSENRSILRESRALQMDSDTQAGFLVAPEQFVREIIKTLDDELIVRRLARKFVVRNARSLGILKRTAQISTFAWGTEISSPAADSTLAYGKRVLHPHPATGEILVSEDLLANTAGEVETEVRTELIQDFGELEEDAFFTGSGAAQPLGIFTASADGISTARDISTDNTATTIEADNLHEVFFSMKKRHRMRGEWIFHRDGIKAVRKLKDSQNRYLWEASLRAGEPDTILGRPVEESERAPNTFTTGQYVGIFGDFTRYYIADALDMTIRRLDELKAETFQKAFIARAKVDGMPVLEEAFSRVTLA